jgi:cytochrome c-type biogenesis protein CcmI
MITSFYFYAAILVVFGLLFVVFPFIRKEKSIETNPNANALRVADYESRLEELSQEVETGKLSEGAYNTAVVEQKQALLQELAPEQQLNQHGNRSVIALTASLFTLTFCVVFYLMTGSFNLLTQWQDAKDNLPELGKRAVLQQGEPLSNNEMQELALGLRTKLAEQGDDEMAWLLLGRIMLMLNDYESANMSFDKAIAMNANNINALVSKAQVLMLEGADHSINQAAKVVSQVLKIEPSNTDALSMLALIAYERGDWQQSLAAFELILGRMSETNPSYAMLNARVEELKVKVAQQSNNSEQNSVGQGLSVSVNITLADELKDQLPANGVLFVFAKAENGPPMPLAVVKKPQWQLPLTVTLSERDAMVAGMTFAEFKRVKIVARISIDDKVDTQAGELEGHTQGFDIEQINQVNLTIDKLL